MKNKKTSIENMRDLTLQKRYLMKDAQGSIIETEDQMYRRVAAAIAGIEAAYGASEKRIKVLTRQFYRLMKKGLFLPNSPTLMNAGRKNGLLSACFVLPIEDSIDGIFTTVKNAAIIQKAGGGVGYDFSLLRPTGDLVASSGGTTSGPISFMKVVSEATQAIQQGAFRRGANMGMMNIDHPDILKFIVAKQNPEVFTNFNISVKVTDAFMKQLQDDPEGIHIVTNPRNKNQYAIPHSVNIHSYTINDLIPAGGAAEECYTTRQVWDMIVQNAHKSGEPGICFIDHVNQYNPTPLLGKINATNPCGEQPLFADEACNLGSMNVAAFIHNDDREFDWKALKKTVKSAVRFLDNVIDANTYPIPEIKQVTLANRKIGLGVMGFADALILLGISYNSDKAVQFANRLMSFIQEQSHLASSTLAKERGCFINYKGSTWDTEYLTPMRNAAVTTIAPTGSISIIAGCSSGIEPVYSFAYKRKALDEGEFLQIHPLLEKLGTAQGWLDEVAKNMLLEGKSIQDIQEIPKNLRSTLVTAHDVSPEQHVNIQAAFQQYTDNAVSKTVNLPSEASVEDVDKIFRLAFQLGCKGTTIYRNLSRQNQVITAAHQEVAQGNNTITPRDRSRKTQGETIKYTMGCGKLYVSVNKDEHGLCEVFANLGKAGGCPAQSEATCRIVSAAIRSGVDPHILIEQLKGIRCLSTISSRKTNKEIDVLSCPDAIARAIEEAMGGSDKPKAIFSTNKCPDCSFPLRRDSGCNVCDNCGYTKCG